MRLTDLDPRWLVDSDGSRKGLVFWCPHCIGTPKATSMTCFFEPTKLFGAGEDWESAPGTQVRMVDDALGDEPGAAGFIPCNQKSGWKVDPPVAIATFESISITPSLDASPAGHWHGFIKNGQVQ